jgi:hypothetical protein
MPPPPFRFLDADVVPGVTYFYRLEAVDLSDGREFFGPVAARIELESVGSAGLGSRLGQSHPNPFRSEDGRVMIGFALAARGRARVRILDASGRHIRLLMDEVLESGEHVEFWDGRNERGEAVSSGIYFYRLDAEGFTASRPLIRLR